MVVMGSARQYPTVEPSVMFQESGSRLVRNDLLILGASVELQLLFQKMLFLDNVAVIEHGEW